MVAAREAAKQFADELTPNQSGIDCLRGHGDGPGVADDQPGGDQECAGQVTVRRPYRHRGGDLHRAAGHRHGWRGDRWRRHALPRAVLRRQGDDRPTRTTPRAPTAAHRQNQGVPVFRRSRSAPHTASSRSTTSANRCPSTTKTMKKIWLSGGNSYNAATLAELRAVYSSLQRIGYETIKEVTPASAGCGWVRWRWRWRR